MATNLNGWLHMVVPHSYPEIPDGATKFKFYNNFNLMKTDGTYYTINGNTLAADARNFGKTTGPVNIVTTPLSETLVLDDANVIPHANIFHIFCNELTKFKISDMTSLFNAREADTRFETPDVVTYEYGSFHQSALFNTPADKYRCGTTWLLRSFCTFDWGPSITDGTRDDSEICIKDFKMGVSLLEQTTNVDALASSTGMSKYLIYSKPDTVQATIKAPDTNPNSVYTNFESFIESVPTNEGTFAIPAITTAMPIMFSYQANWRGRYMGPVGAKRENYVGQTFYDNMHAKIGGLYDNTFPDYNNVDFLFSCGTIE